MTRAAAISVTVVITTSLGLGRRIIASAAFALNRADESRAAAQMSLTLCRQAGDRYGIGNALNSLAFTDDDLADTILRFADMRKRRSRLNAGAVLPRTPGPQ